MRGFFLALLLAGGFLRAAAQEFRGEILYHNRFETHMNNMTDEQLALVFGSEQDYFILDGAYKSITNGVAIEWQLYKPEENRIFTKIPDADTVIWSDAAVNPDSVLSSAIRRNDTTILGYPCDLLVLTCRSGTQKYYFSAKLPVDPAPFARHAFGNWAFVMAQIRAVPLKIVIESPQFTLESTATRVNAIRPDASMFALPAHAVVIKSPY